METAQSKSRLLLVDGDLKSLRVLDVSLKKAGFNVSTATSGREALALLEASLPDLIISDTDLDEMDGFELCRQIKARPDANKIPFLFVSSRKSIEDKIRGLELGVDDYLSKPIYIKEIGIRVRTALQRAERERMESRREGRTRFAGELSDVGVVDLVQTIELNRKSGIIHIVNRDNRRGSMFFRDGKVVDAEVGRLSGANAVYRLFSWSEGQFAVEFKQIRRHDVVDSPMAQLLMEGMRRLDETTRLLDKLPSPRALLEVDCRVLAEQLAELPDEMNSVLRLCDGTRTLQEVLEDSEHADLEALTILSKLFNEHIIFARAAPDQAGQSVPSERLALWLAEGGAAEDGAVGDDPSGSSDFPAPMQLGEEGDAPPTIRSPAKTLKLPAITEQPRAVDESGSGEESLGAVLPPREEGIIDSDTFFSRAVDTLKGVPIDSLFAGLGEPTPEPRPNAVVGAAPGPAARPTGHRSDFAARSPGLAERMLSEDSAVRASAMHEAACDPAGTVVAPLAMDRHTREYGSPEQAAALVDEVVSGAHQAKRDKPLVEPARPSKEVDWGAWSTDQGKDEATEVPGPAPLANELPMPSDLADRPRATPPDSAPAAQVTEAIALATESVAAHRPEAVAEARAQESSIATQATTRQLLAEPNPVTRLPTHNGAHIDSRTPVTAELPVSPARRLWLWALGAFAAGLVGFLVVSRNTHESAVATGPRTAAPDVPGTAAGARSQPAQQSAVPTPRPAEPPPPASGNTAAAGSNAPSGAAPTLPNRARQGAQSAPAAAPVKVADSVELRRRCLEVDSDGKGKAKVVANVCRPALEADPKDVDVLVVLARAELDRGRLAEARALAKKALAVDVQRVEAYIYLGNVEQEAGNVDDARAAYKKYLELAPNGPFARELRAILSNL